MVIKCIFVIGNNVSFVSKPTVERNATHTIVKDCKYTSARDTNLVDYAYIKINGILYKLNTTQHGAGQQDGRVFTFPEFKTNRLDTANVHQRVPDSYKVYNVFSFCHNLTPQV